MQKIQETSTIKKHEDGTIVLSITIPSFAIKKMWEEVMVNTVKTATLPGFRQGKAPREMVEKTLDKEKIRDEVLRNLLPTAYVEAVKEHNIKPIINPKIHIAKIESPLTGPGDSSWEFTATTCEVPNVKLENYKEEIKKITAKSKIVILGQEEKKVNLDEIVKKIIESVKVTIPDILFEEEVERQLSQLLGEIKKLGLSLDQYLASTNKTSESLKNEYQEKVKMDIAIEFALQKIAEIEKIVVSQKEIDEALQKAKSDTERKQLESNLYLLSNILRQQKTLDFLKNL